MPYRFLCFTRAHKLQHAHATRTPTHVSTVRAGARPRWRASHPTACGARQARKGAVVCRVDPPPRPDNRPAQRGRPGLLRRFPGPPPPHIVRVSHPIRRPPATAGATARVRGDERQRARESEREAVGMAASPCCCSGGSASLRPRAGPGSHLPEETRRSGRAPTRDDGRQGEWRGDRGRSRPLSVSASKRAHPSESPPESIGRPRCCGRHRRRQRLRSPAVVIRN